MNTFKVQKNFLIDKSLIENAQNIILKKHKNLTEAITLYLEAIVKNPNIIEDIKQEASKRNASFIGMLDGQIGDINYKNLYRL